MKPPPPLDPPRLSAKPDTLRPIAQAAVTPNPYEGGGWRFVASPVSDEQLERLVGVARELGIVVYPPNKMPRVQD